MMGRANQSVANLNSVMVEYISGMKLIKAYNMGSKSFQKFSAAVKEENDVWNEMSKRMGPFYASFIVVIECGMLLLVPLGGMLFLNGSITASVFLLFAFVGSMYLTEIRPLQEISSNMAQVLKAVTKTEEILELPIYEGGGDFSVTLQHSKVSDSVLASEIQGEAGSLVIEKLSECQKVCFVPRGSQMQDLTQPQHINTMLYEAELFATLVDEHLVDHPGLAVSRITAKLLTEIRRQTGVIFPADSVKL